TTKHCPAGDSSHLPRSLSRYVMTIGGTGGAPVQELRAGYNRLYERAKAISVRREPGVHPLDERFVREDQRSAQRVYQQLPGDVVQKIFFPVLPDVLLQPAHTGSLTSAGKRGPGIDGMPGEIVRPQLAGRTVVLQRQPERVESRVARGACRVAAMVREHVAQRRIELGFVAGQLRDHWRRR